MERLESLREHLSPSLSSVEPSETAAVQLEEHYDFIVVGGGSAGCVVAARLSEDPKVSVLLLEAGLEDDTFIINTPIMYAKQQLTDIDWQFRTERQANQNDRVSFWPRGKVLGGSSSINAMLYVRGDRDTYDGWARAGCTGWGYHDVLPYFKRSENCLLPDAEREFHGQGGDLAVTSPPHNVYADDWVKAATQAGIPFNKDYNGSRMEGVSFSQSTIDGGIRQNTSRAFLRRHRAARKNLTVVTGAHVTRVLFQGRTAIGVQFKRGSAVLEEVRKRKTEVAFCRREVVLSAGAVASPWILLLSGVGPREELEALGIPVVADLPVGKNLQDHLMSIIGFQTKDNLSMRPNIDLRAVMLLTQYLVTKGGPFGNSHLHGTAFVHTGLRGDGSPQPDLQFHFYPGTFNLEAAAAANLAVDEFWKDVDANWGQNAISIIPTLLRPKSVGELRLRSRDPFDHPIIQPNYFSDPEGYDLSLLVEGFKRCRKIAKQPALASKIAKEIVDTTIRHPSESDEYIRAYIKKTALTVYHPVGTCKMGAPSDPTAVVCPALKVRGLQGIRVADASIMPYIVNANTNAPAIMIGEKAADLIKADLSKK